MRRLSRSVNSSASMASIASSALTSPRSSWRTMTSTISNALGMRNPTRVALMRSTTDGMSSVGHSSCIAFDGEHPAHRIVEIERAMRDDIAGASEHDRRLARRAAATRARSAVCGIDAHLMTPLQGERGLRSARRLRGYGSRRPCCGPRAPGGASCRGRCRCCRRR